MKVLAHRKLFTAVLVAILLCANTASFAQMLSPVVPNIRVGTTTTGAPGTSASVTNVGTGMAPMLNFSLPRGNDGAAGPTGAAGAAGVNSYSAPSSRTVALATAYQCADPTKPCEVTLNLTSTASLTLTTGVSNTADILVGATNGVAGGTGTVIGKYSNSMTGTLIVGLGINTVAGTPISLHIPTGYYFAVRQTAGTVAITSAFDQSVG